jgi:rubrerythrin
MLSTRVKTTDDLMSIALQAEREAIRRYSQLSTRMREAGNESAAALFERMVIEEQEHERLLQEWMAQESIDENPEIGPIHWRDPQVSTIYDDEARNPHHSTPYKALAFAVHNEEIAFRFYTHVASDSDNEAVRKYAEILAREELGHAALLRAERRLAYHAERNTSLVEPVLDPGAIHCEADLLAVAIHIDRYLADTMNMITTDSPLLLALTREVQQQISNNKNALASLALHSKELPGEDISSNLAQVESYHAHIEEKTNSPNSNLQRLSAYCDRCFAFYDAIVESAADESIMLAAQKLTSLALDRIGVLLQTPGKEHAADKSQAL